MKAFLLGVMLMLLSGCGLWYGLAGIKTDDQGNVIGTHPTAPLGGVAGFLDAFGVYGAFGAIAVRWGLVEYRHQMLLKAGRKDSNRNGVDDEDEPVKP